ncbi:glycosyltransferase family 2 protein [uncultured Brachyspira sp.]|uniref:glycosyltransferase family 2 protein n=1 Tax=uncultured Brachyspira sp. TaxID=221953 RepID=UPI00262C1419|nr:glycosyltransferase family 2 protein [uncultured Brachyspira sp.]
MNRIPFFSIIVPVYNTEQYLKRCLDSIVNQTFKDIEIIIVNDHSPKNCDEIISQYKDERIIYIKHEVNKGLLLARKIGNIKASGKYIIYVDSDDEVNINMCNDVYKECQKKNYDVIHFNTKAILDDNINISKKDKERLRMKAEWYVSSRRSLINEKYLLYEVIEEKIPHNMWGKAYKTSIIKKITEYIPDIKLMNAEDMLQSLMIYYFAESYCTISNQLYYYYISIGESNKNTSNLSYNSYNYLCECSSIACKEFFNFLEKQGTEILYGTYYYKIYYNQYRFLKEKIVDNENKKEFEKILETHFDTNIIDKYLKLKEYEDIKLNKYEKIINKLIPYFFSIIMFEYYINIKIFGIKINLKKNKSFKEPIVISFNSLLKNIFSINTDNKKDKYIKILFMKIKLK